MFVTVFNKNGNVDLTSGYLNEKQPSIPAGVFAYAAAHGEDRFTWQPENGVRIAAVVVPYNNGYVLAGRNMKEVEKREDNLFRQIILGWIGTVILTFCTAVICSLFLKKAKKLNNQLTN